MSVMSDFKCDKCQTFFKVGSGGFIGSLDDFEFQMNPNDKELLKDQESFECSPFMNYVQLCNLCYSKELKRRGGNHDNH